MRARATLSFIKMHSSRTGEPVVLELKGKSTHPESLIWPWVRVRKVDDGPGAGESGGLGALRHKGVSVATGFVRAWHGRGTKGGNCGQVDAQKKGLVRLSSC